MDTSYNRKYIISSHTSCRQAIKTDKKGLVCEGVVYEEWACLKVYNVRNEHVYEDVVCDEWTREQGPQQGLGFRV